MKASVNASRKTRKKIVNLSKTSIPPKIGVETAITLRTGSTPTRQRPARRL